MNNDTVILLHGLGRTAFSMRKLERSLRQAGYYVINPNYPSRKQTVEQLSEGFLHNLVSRLKISSNAKLHIVTHSLGGIVCRYYLDHHEIENLGRVVMLAPPSRGSEVADALQKSAISRYILGPVISQLGTGTDGVPQRLGLPRFELGIITGNRSRDPVLSRLIKGPSDGKVSVERAQVDGMTDFLIVPCGHTFIMNNRDVIRQVIGFLRDGWFERK